MTVRTELVEVPASSGVWAPFDKLRAIGNTSSARTGFWCLATKLRSTHANAPHSVLCFTPDVGSYMQLADFFIGKPGPGCLSEAVQMGLPVITVHNAWTMPQERYNTRWVREQGVGLVLPSMRAIRAGVAEMVLRLPEFRECVNRIDNRAVFEVPQILADLLQASATVLPTAQRVAA